MRLFLSSQGIPSSQREEFVRLFSKPASTIRVAHITDASEVYTQSEQEPWRPEAEHDLAQTGVSCHNIRLLNFKNDRPSLAVMLSQMDGVWVAGGNPHYLRYAMQASGFDQLITHSPANFVYGGYSAGAMVAGPTIKYADLDGEPHQEPFRVDEGLNLTDLVIIPHANQPERQVYIKQMSDLYQREGHKVHLLSDNEVFIQDGVA